MFLISLIRNEELSEMLKSGLEEDENRKKLYSIIFVDPAEATCQNKGMRDRLLDEAIDYRWSDWGTIYAATNYSMLCITTDDAVVDDSVALPFIAEYRYLVSLVLAQKTGIQKFSEEASDIVKNVDKKGLIGNKRARSIMNLQERYITFKSQEMLLEVSCEDQGIELYQLLQKQLQVAEEQQILDGQLENLYEVTNVSLGVRFQWIGVVIAVGAIAADAFLNMFIY